MWPCLDIFGSSSSSLNHILTFNHYHETYSFCTILYCCFSSCSRVFSGQIGAQTGLGKFTTRRIGRELEMDKENHPGGCSAKLIPHDKQAIVQQISTERLDTTVQATNFINNIISNPVSPQTVWNVLKEEGYWSATKRKVPMLKARHRQLQLKWAQEH